MPGVYSFQSALWASAGRLCKFTTTQSLHPFSPSVHITPKGKERRADDDGRGQAMGSLGWMSSERSSRSVDEQLSD
ncbi:hypothetical protein niasHT_030724 [Heterodera trifolii]|uniref:Uncharacterized protein n=1 Tax=Heterodera trifolii TaxID=157864 RepID=A0ABD2I5L4_9BILA